MANKNRLHQEGTSLIKFADTFIIYDHQTPFFKFFYHLLLKHPEKEKKLSQGIKGFMVKINLFRQKQIMIIAENNDEIDFGWVQCTKNKIFNYDKSDLRAAFRKAIAHQIIAHPTRQVGMHVHHVIPFETLVLDFESKNPNLDYSIIDDPNGGYQFKSPETKNIWALFHKQEAILEVLTTNEHNKRHKKDRDS